MGRELGRYIKNERTEKKLSMRKFAEETGISRSYLDYIETGAREPQMEALAKISAVLDLPLGKLLDIQEKEKLQSIVTRLKVENRKEIGDEIRAVARTGDSSHTLDQKALNKTLEAFRASPNDKMLAEYIENPNLKAIMRAGVTLSDQELEKIRKVMESLFPDAFME